MNSLSEAATDAALAALDIEPPTEDRRDPYGGLFKPIPALIAERRLQEGSERLRGSIVRLSEAQTTALIRRLATTLEPLMLWALHIELDRRNICPCLRWPARDDTSQHHFITWLADMFWFTKRHPSHEPRFRGWKNLMANRPGSATWHAIAARQFFYANTKYSLAHWSANGLGLSDEQRQELMTLPTTAIGAARRTLRRDEASARHDAFLTHALTHPDRSGRYSAEAVANRRDDLYRTWVLSGKSPTLTATNWAALTGKRISRQAVSTQISLMIEILDQPAPFM